MSIVSSSSSALLPSLAFRRRIFAKLKSSETKASLSLMVAAKRLQSFSSGDCKRRRRDGPASVPFPGGAAPAPPASPSSMPMTHLSKSLMSQGRPCIDAEAWFRKSSRNANGTSATRLSAASTSSRIAASASALVFISSSSVVSSSKLGTSSAGAEKMFSAASSIVFSTASIISRMKGKSLIRPTASLRYPRTSRNVMEIPPSPLKTSRHASFGSLSVTYTFPPAIIFRYFSTWLSAILSGSFPRKRVGTRSTTSYSAAYTEVTGMQSSPPTWTVYSTTGMLPRDQHFLNLMKPSLIRMHTFPSLMLFSYRDTPTAGSFRISRSKRSSRKEKDARIGESPSRKPSKRFSEWPICPGKTARICFVRSSTASICSFTTPKTSVAWATASHTGSKRSASPSSTSFTFKSPAHSMNFFATEMI
mmetsp:Transcript_15215/g.57855  ORF Transcript_15215/g.57855 Transcript_15215/m.57855 type:complete len:419 (-) Transcript_15215:2065-3321(-)